MALHPSGQNSAIIQSTRVAVVRALDYRYCQMEETRLSQPEHGLYHKVQYTYEAVMLNEAGRRTLGIQFQNIQLFWSFYAFVVESAYSYTNNACLSVCLSICDDEVPWS